uniref:Tubulin tyrosine ligase-like family, member 4 n=1 Tax=Denticeps clupeoides TaxID=299321 RepID=A0AAY4ATB3_9TELE
VMESWSLKTLILTFWCVLSFSVDDSMCTEAEDDRVERPALVPSLFPLRPPTLYFSTANERVQLLPWEQRKLLKWKMSSVTPNVVKQTIARSHFRATKKSDDWLGCWGHHMKSPGFKAIHEYQKPASARGIGIQVIHKWSQMPRKRPLLVQKYLHKPYLISGNKFDLRIYVYVTSYDPLRVYIFSDGLVRFASCKYSSSMKSLSNKFMHLTNYSVNKKNSEYQTNSDHKACQGHKWALKALWQYLSAKGINTTQIWEMIKDMVIKTIIASDPYVNMLVKANVRSPYSCHELFGFDIMLDENLKPWVLEVNISPSLHSNTALDVSIKGQMIRDVLNLAGFVVPRREEMRPAACGSTSSSTSSLCGGVWERSRPELSADEKVKRAFYLSQRFADQLFSSVLDVLTPDDVNVLAEAEDELSRRGEFERVFPSPASSRYLRFFEHPRYLNILLSQWEQKHWQNRSQGVSLLRNLCQKGVHLGHLSDTAHRVSSAAGSISSLVSCTINMFKFVTLLSLCNSGHLQPILGALGTTQTAIPLRQTGEEGIQNPTHAQLFISVSFPASVKLPSPLSVACWCPRVPGPPRRTTSRIARFTRSPPASPTSA